jgi:hypothetical protein
METNAAIMELRKLIGDNYNAIAVLQAIVQVLDDRLAKCETLLAYQGKVTRNETPALYRSVPDEELGLE